MASWAVVLLLSFAAVILLSPQPATSNPPPASKGFSLQLIDRDSIHSPFYPGNLTTAQQLRRMVESSEARLQWLNSSILQPHDVGIRPTVTIDGWRFIVSLGIGTSSVNQLLLLDTGSDTIWAQCFPCTRCFPQDAPRFRPSSTRTFQVLPCEHPLCVPRTCVNGVCRFTRSYLGGKVTKGTLATENFTFRTRSGSTETISDIVFGCATKNSENMFPRTTKIAGILGMGGGPQSLSSQLGDGIRHGFSYCLLPRGHEGFSYLRFGTDIVVRRNAQSTPFLQTNKPTRYYLNLLDITVNIRRLNIPRGTFTRRSDGTGGCFIDSGAAITYLIRPAYDSVKSALTDYFRRYNLEMTSGHQYHLDLCYRKLRGFEAYPSMILHFSGANLLLRTENLFLIDNSIFCLTILPDDRYTILGAAQQGNIQFIYDTGRRQLTFAPMDCAHN